MELPTKIIESVLKMSNKTEENIKLAAITKNTNLANAIDSSGHALRQLGIENEAIFSGASDASRCDSFTNLKLTSLERTIVLFC